MIGESSFRAVIMTIPVARNALQESEAKPEKLQKNNFNENGFG